MNKDNLNHKRMPIKVIWQWFIGYFSDMLANNQPIPLPLSKTCQEGGVFWKLRADTSIDRDSYPLTQ